MTYFTSVQSTEVSNNLIHCIYVFFVLSLFCCKKINIVCSIVDFFIMANIIDSILKSSNFVEDRIVSHSEETRLKNMIQKNFSFGSINEVKKLNNKYLYASFMLKKSQKKDYRIIELIHSTAAENVDSIEKNNLDWRLTKRSKYGRGVSFSENSDYANYHSSWSGGNRRAFIICDVLLCSKENVGDNDNEAPINDVDTFQSHNGYVYVKFDDFTFYPKYALYYDKPSHTSSKFYRKRTYHFVDDIDDDF